MRYEVLRQVDTEEGWERVSKFGSLRKAEEYVRREENRDRRYSSHYPDRVYLCLQPVLERP